MSSCPVLTNGCPSCSQPPLLSQMVALVYNANPDISLLQDALPLLQDEHDYWTR